MGNFFKGILKIALAMFFAVLALAGVGWGIVGYQNKNERLEAQKYEVVRIWRVDLKENLQLNLVARTKMLDGRLRVDLDLDGYPPYLSHPRLEARNRNGEITILFADKDGFKVYEKALKVSEFSTTVDPKGKKIGLNHQFDDYLGLAAYKSISNATVRWNLETVIPPEPKVATTPTPTPKVSNEPATDHCAPGLTRAQRLQRLARHGTLRQVREDTYEVGYRQVTFFPERLGGELLSCR